MAFLTDSATTNAERSSPQNVSPSGSLPDTATQDGQEISEDASAAEAEEGSL